MAAWSPTSRVSAGFTFAPVVRVSMERIVLRGAFRRYPDERADARWALRRGVVVST
jgi:hypothetical protein